MSNNEFRTPPPPKKKIFNIPPVHFTYLLLLLYNNILAEIYDSSFEIMAPLQFKDYVTSQRITRWKIEKDVTRLEQKVQNVLSPESKDGRAQNVARFSFSSEVMRTVRPGDSFKAESSKKVIQQMLDEVTVKLQEIVNLR